MSNTPDESRGLSAEPSRDSVVCPDPFGGTVTLLIVHDGTFALPDTPYDTNGTVPPSRLTNASVPP